MLAALYIEQFAIVSRLELDFSSGMSAFTGETGAGKSIMIDALMLALGGRADASVVRVGADKCEIHAHFTFDSGSMPEIWLAANDFLGEPGEVILRRVIFAEGRSKSYINGLPCSLQTLKNLSETLVDIHGQHQHQRLLHHTTHRMQLDQYAKHDELLNSVENLYKQCKNLEEELRELTRQEQISHNANILHEQLTDLETLNLKDGELEALHAEHQCLHHAHDHLHTTQQLLDLLNNDDHPNIRRQLNQCMHLLSSLPATHSSIKNIMELINSALIQCDEAFDELAMFATNVQLNPEKLQTIEQRMSLIHQTARKHHVDASQLLNHQQQLHATLANLNDRDQRKQQLITEHQQALNAYQHAALALRASRQHFSPQLANEVSAIIQQLGMPKGFISVKITPLETMHSHGLDKIEYYVCTNPGMLPDTLTKIASGGELSRISLAIQMITAQRGATPTLLFDEVDVGIGGATAALVGKMLRNLGERLQLFCVTHQAQVAAAAHNHYRVEKHSNHQETFSTIYPLSPTERVEEIARMLAGLTLTPQSLSHAATLLAQLH